MSTPKQLIFQLGTNNWQRQDEFAPGSGILHSAHHDCLNAAIENTSSFSVYPSKNQKQELLEDAEQAFVRIFPLTHDIPICESVSPVSTYRWHAMSEEVCACAKLPRGAMRTPGAAPAARPRHTAAESQAICAAPRLDRSSMPTVSGCATSASRTSMRSRRRRDSPSRTPSPTTPSSTRS